MSEDSLKTAVRDHWQRETCGTRYASAADRRQYFDEVSQRRYQLEPYIAPFADFPSGAGKNVLEIGVGAGADFENWCAYADHATGIDLTERAAELTRERLELAGVPTDRYTLKVSDAESLPFEDSCFDLVYSWGVLHHTPDTPAAFREVCRVLKPGGQVRAMIYRVPCWVGLMLYLNYGLARGRPRMTQKQAVFEHLESPGTKAYTDDEGRRLVQDAGFVDIDVQPLLSFGDYFRMEASSKYRGLKFKLIKALYPRWFVRLLGHRYGGQLLIKARKPER